MALPNPTERRPWGEYQNLFEGDGFLVKLIEVGPGQRNSLQRHAKRDEYWIVARGEGVAELDGKSRRLKPGDLVPVPCGSVHRFACDGAEPLLILELQRGECREDDIERLEDDYGRAAA